MKGWRRNSLITASLLVVGIPLYLTLPILRGEYLSPTGEFFLYQAYLRNFLATLCRGELPLWNPYVGGGHPALYFGHYPIHQALLLYGLFGFDQTGFATVKLFNLFLLFGGYLYAARRWRIPLFPATLGALLYLGINFCVRFLISDTVSNSVIFYPLVFLLLIKIVEDRFTKKRDLILYLFAFAFWVTGVSITYLIMPLLILIWAYFDQTRRSQLDWKKTTGGFLLLLVAPWLCVLYQLYFIYDLIIDSNRLKGGLLLSPLTAQPWVELFRSLVSSSYLWMTLAVFSAAGIFRSGRSRWLKILLLWCLALLLLLGIRFLPGADPISDYVTLLHAPSFWLASLLFFAWGYWKKGRAAFRAPVLLEFFVITSLLSYYFYLPENAPGIREPGYDYALFVELGVLAQTIFDFGIYFSLFADKWRKQRRLAILGLFVTYLFRSHFALPLMRFTNILWYAPRDGMIFSFLFSLLFLCGTLALLKTVTVRAARPLVCGIFLLVLLQAVHYKMYSGVSHQYLFSTKNSAARLEAAAALTKDLETIRDSEKGFFRIFSPTNSLVLLAGSFQDRGIYEAGLYESSIPSRMSAFYRNVILGIPARGAYPLSESLPYGQFTKHVHRALGLTQYQIAYHDFYLYDAEDDPYLVNGNIEFWWDLAQVKYLLVTNRFAKVLSLFPTHAQYEPIGEYPALDLHLFRVRRPKSYATLALLLPREGETMEKIMSDLNSDDISTLRGLYSRLISVESAQTRRPSNSTLSLEVEAPREGLVVQFESWNRHWRLQSEGEPAELSQAFHLFRAMRVHPGRNRIEMEYVLPGFRALVGLGFCFPFLFILMLYRGGWCLALLRQENLRAIAGSLRRRLRGLDFLEMRLSLKDDPPLAPAFGKDRRRAGYTAIHHESCLSLLNRVGSLGYWNRKRFEREILGRVEDPARDLFLILDGETVCGFSALHGPSFSPNRLPEIGYFAVDPRYRGRGLGGKMLQALLAEGHSRGMREMCLLTDAFRLAAITTYLRAGFRPWIRSESDRQRWKEAERKLCRYNAAAVLGEPSLERS